MELVGNIALVDRSRRHDYFHADLARLCRGPDAAGQPVNGASVLLFERGFVTHQERGRATSDAQGVFRFADNRSHSIQLEAEAPGRGRTDRRIVRLWFAAQDVQIAEPLRFAAAK